MTKLSPSMTKEQLSKEVRRLISKNHIKLAIGLIRREATLEPNKQKELSIISGRLNYLDKIFLSTHEDERKFKEDIESIIYDILIFTSKLKDEDLQKTLIADNRTVINLQPPHLLLNIIFSGFLILILYLLGVQFWIVGSLIIIALIIISSLFLLERRIRNRKRRIITPLIGTTSPALHGSVNFEALRVEAIYLREKIWLKKSNSNTRLIDVKIDKDFDQFTYADALEIISKVESLIEKENVKLKGIERGSTILKLKLEYEDALLLIKLIQEGKLKDLGVSSASIEEFISNPEEYRMAFSAMITASPPAKKKKAQSFKLRPFIRRMKNTLTSDTPQVLLKTKAKIKESSPKFNQIIQLTAKYNRLKDEKINGVNDREYSDIVASQVSASLLNLLDSLTIEDIDLN